ncbi:hypothetical protein [Streptomyces sp. NRRL B-24484]|uniref:hypothetical protein n=1 Tax=Streptomyces sp. NRRL B-24484 TaxID=1463833 RepID=UPI0004BFACCF|nr:hypothetical protein [Streptomyces sp. NRRL B-24484]
MPATTLGAVFTGLALLIVYGFVWWYREGHRAAALLPWFLAMAYGILATLTAGSLLQVLAGTALWGSGGLGDLALVFGVGTGTGDVTASSSVALTKGGGIVVALLTVVMVCLLTIARRSIPWLKTAGGMVSGVCLALTSVIAGPAAVPLASAANLIGSIFTSAGH